MLNATSSFSKNSSPIVQDNNNLSLKQIFIKDRLILLTKSAALPFFIGVGVGVVFIYCCSLSSQLVLGISFVAVIICLSVNNKDYLLDLVQKNSVVFKIKNLFSKSITLDTGATTKIEVATKKDDLSDIQIPDTLGVVVESQSIQKPSENMPMLLEKNYENQHIEILILSPPNANIKEDDLSGIEIPDTFEVVVEPQSTHQPAENILTAFQNQNTNLLNNNENPDVILNQNTEMVAENVDEESQDTIENQGVKIRSREQLIATIEAEDNASDDTEPASDLEEMDSDQNTELAAENVDEESQHTIENQDAEALSQEQLNAITEAEENASDDTEPASDLEEEEPSGAFKNFLKALSETIKDLYP